MKYIQIAALAALMAAVGSDPVRGAAEPESYTSLKKAAAASQELSFGEHIKPFLQEYCVKCHGNERQKGDIDFTVFGSDTRLIEESKHWEKVRDILRAKEMPPEDEPQPSEVDRRLVVQFIDKTLAEFDCTGAVNPGHVVIRRLNRTEYSNTIRDLVGVEFDAEEHFPRDEVGYGFDNIGSVLSLPPILMEKYLDAAQQIVDKAIVSDYPPDPPRRRLNGEELIATGDARPYQGQALGLWVEGDTGHNEFEFSKRGEYILRFKAFAQQAGPEPARMGVQLGEETFEAIAVTAVEGEPEIYEIRTELAPGERRLTLTYLNNYNVQDHPDPEMRGDRNLFVDFVEVEGPVDVPPPPLPETHKRIISSMPESPSEEKACAKEILSDFARRAYRRPVSDAEVDRLTQFLDVAKAEGDDFIEGIKLAMQAVLASPHFLFRWELDPRESEEAGQDGEVRALTHYEMASRLSYFLWSSMPDEELFRLAEQGVLTEKETLEEQVRRMLLDPKAEALVNNFAGQWLQIRNLAGATPDPELYPDFDEKLRQAMRTETELFFGAIMREDRSVLELIDSDFTFLNERLAKHYGIDGVEGEEFQKVSLDPGNPRGGILTQASILTITSNPTRTSPVNRGKWVLEQILGTPPPPPPPGVPDLEEDEEAIEAASLRQRLEQHRAKPECATCHSKMDPIGFAFENFNAVGAFRERDGKFPIDPSGTLPSGENFNGPGELKKILKQRETFVRTLVEKMLVYALGRGLEYYDQCVVDDTYHALVNNDYRFSVLITEIVKSRPFRMKKGKGNQS